MEKDEDGGDGEERLALSGESNECIGWVDGRWTSGEREKVNECQRKGGEGGKESPSKPSSCFESSSDFT
jgi:hypothetical protein